MGFVASSSLKDCRSITSVATEATRQYNLQPPPTLAEVKGNPWKAQGQYWRILFPFSFRSSSVASLRCEDLFTEWHESNDQFPKQHCVDLFEASENDASDSIPGGPKMACIAAGQGIQSS